MSTLNNAIILENKGLQSIRLLNKKKNLQCREENLFSTKHKIDNCQK